MATLFRSAGAGLSLRWGAARGKTSTAVLRLVEEKMRVGFIGLGMMGKGRPGTILSCTI
jgi:hypothetical protein